MNTVRQPEHSSPEGLHYLINFFGCDNKQLNSVEFWKEVLPESLQGTTMTVLNSHFYKFNPHGITGFLLLSASHIAVHTWPEYNYVACDIFSCSCEQETQKAVDYLIKNIKHLKVDIQKISRGYQFVPVDNI
jgi:S-adenosylmethionine decarboxylase proenzyme